MEFLKKLLLYLLVLCLLGSGITACHTLQGAGQDIKETGEELEEETEERTD